MIPQEVGDVSMEFGYRINGEVAQSLNEKQKMIWTLDALQKASVAREEYFRQHDALLGPLDGFNPQRHQGNNLMRVIMVDLVFTMVRSIEAFLGAVGVAWKISTSNRDASIKSLHSWLLRPGSKTLQEILDILSEREIDNETLCKLCGFSIPENLKIDKRDQKNLWKTYNETLKRMKIYGFFATWYMNEFKEVRNIYSHNMRFLFLNISQKDGEEIADSVGLLGSKERSPNYLLLICETQRKAIRELAIRLCQLERIIHENIKFCVLNDCMPVPPVSLVSIPDELQNDLKRIKEGLGFEWIIPAIRIEIRDNVSIEKQFHLHSDFLQEITNLG